MDQILPVGKLPNALLGRLLARYATPDPRLIIGPGVGHDAAAIALDDRRALVVKSDPITFATAEIGWYLVNVNANDLACLGATPRWLLVTALLPEGQTTPATVEAIFSGLHDACVPLGIALVGGHTELTYGIDRPLLVGTLLGEADQAGLIRPGAARAGDTILLTGGIAVEGTALIANERPAEVAARHGAAFVARCQGFLRDPGISVVRAAAVARAHGATALHDPTEGGLAMGLRELATAAGLGLRIDAARLPVFPETAALCADYGLDPLGLIASGALLIVVPPAASAALVAALGAEGVAAAAIGEFTAASDGLVLRRHDRDEPLPSYPADEITRLFAAPSG